MRTALRLRVHRQWLLARTVRKGLSLRAAADRTGAIRPCDHLLFCTLRGGAERLPRFLDYYRALGIDHFLFVDNGGADAAPAILMGAPDVSLWRTDACYQRARFGMDWHTVLARRHGHGHWCLTVEPGELFVYPHQDSRPLPALTDRLEDAKVRAFPATRHDLGPDGGAPRPFDPGAGGVLPLVRWHRSYAYADGTRALLPRRLNRARLHHGLTSGVLLRPEADGPQRAATRHPARESGGWRRLETLGLMSRGGWA